MNHQPNLARELYDGPGNRSRVVDCSCGARPDDGEKSTSRWYAQHAGIANGAAAVEGTLRRYDAALDARDYPDATNAQHDEPRVILRELDV